jgi:hypothetical protein
MVFSFFLFPAHLYVRRLHEIKTTALCVLRSPSLTDHRRHTDCSQTLPYRTKKDDAENWGNMGCEHSFFFLSLIDLCGSTTSLETTNAVSLFIGT